MNPTYSVGFSFIQKRDKYIIIQMERIKKKYIGQVISVRKPVRATVTIEDNPDNYAYYKSLGLDIFEEVKTRKKREKFPKNKKVDESKDNERTSEHGSTDADGEDNA